MKYKIVLQTTILFAFLLYPLLLTADELPELPEHLATPFEGVENKKQLNSAHQLKKLFDDNNYTLEMVHAENKLPKMYTTNLPNDLNKLLVPEKTSLFIQLLLPSVVKVNNDILTVRDELTKITEKIKAGTKLTSEESSWLESIASAYHGTPDNIQDLHDRIDALPVGLVMAQAIDESGWGTSHFAIAGNALYGQHLGKNSKGTYLTTSGGHVRVASFDNLYHSTASYIHNLNTTKAYKKLRDDRTAIKAKHGEVKGAHLAESLLHYSERGQHYVDTLKWLIKHYKLDELNTITFDEKTPSTLIKLTQ